MEFNTMEIKKCTLCKIEKTIDNFNNKKGGKYGKNSICRKCQLVTGRF